MKAERNTPEEILEVVQAFKDGKKIMFQDRLRPNSIGPASAPCWDFGRYRYFVKPEPRKPRTVFVNIYDKDSGLPSDVGAAGFDKRDVESKRAIMWKGETVEFVEVMKDQT